MRTEGFFYNLDILYGGLGIGKLQFLIKKKLNKNFTVIFFQFLVIKALDPDWIRIRIRIGIQHHTLDPDPGKMNTDPQPCKCLDNRRENRKGKKTKRKNQKQNHQQKRMKSEEEEKKTVGTGIEDKKEQITEVKIINRMTKTKTMNGKTRTLKKRYTN